MAEELSVVLRRSNDGDGLGFSLLGTAGLPPIIYDIVENSPAAECGEVCCITILFFRSSIHRFKPLIYFKKIYH